MMQLPFPREIFRLLRIRGERMYSKLVHWDEGAPALW